MKTSSCKYVTLFIVFSICASTLWGQNSYVRKLSAENFTFSAIGPLGIGKGTNDDLSMMLFSPPGFALLNLSSTGEVIQSFQII